MSNTENPSQLSHIRNFSIIALADHLCGLILPGKMASIGSEKAGAFAESWRGLVRAVSVSVSAQATQASPGSCRAADRGVSECLTWPVCFCLRRYHGSRLC